MARSVVKNTIFVSATFEDAAGTATDPDPGTDIVWTVYGQDESTIRATETQEPGDAVDGAFEFAHTPTEVETIYIEILGTVGGEQQVHRFAHKVTWI